MTITISQKENSKDIEKKINSMLQQRKDKKLKESNSNRAQLLKISNRSSEIYILKVTDINLVNSYSDKCCSDMDKRIN